ncbi:transglutaminase domain-containing protein [Paenibacillus sp. alder61]|uniref:DUF4129 domain-containing transglutaminase family protein n=1 Tax=Paenibacillus sp. alder61 TaxID=2862948 RepID=UPI001CD48663|nr:transglutaminase domain-containing protein [Paenibacillus sp. alder61]MCA1292906.1 transglutaminase domain-containing protein [Paenibacillus sp. alder61]
MKRAVNRQYSWYRIFAVLWLLLIGMQWVDYTEPLWFSETTTLVTVTLLTIAIIEVLPVPSPWKWSIKIIAVVLGWRAVLVVMGAYVPYGPFFPDQLQGMAQQFVPYIWFSLGAWVLFELALELLTGKRSVLLFMAANLITFTILDSFTSYYLWQNVAWTVFAGLGWLASLHFRNFQLKYPLGWRRMRSQPLKLAFNILAIFSCILLVGISMPTVSPILTDPYTAWKNRESASEPADSAALPAVAAANTPTDQGGDRTEVQSGYSRDDRELGGGFEFSYTPVMSVETPVRSYWRGETRRTYTGEGWAGLGQEGRDYELFHENPTGTLPHKEQAPKTEVRRVEQTITMQNEEVYPVLFGGYAMKSVEVLDEGVFSSNLEWTEKEGELFWLGMGQAVNRGEESTRLYPRKYKVVSDIPIIPLEEVRRATYEELYPERKYREYLQIPNGFPDRVRELAEQVTAEGATPYAKMELLQAYLRQNYEYTNKPDLSRKKSKDFVDGFLFDVKQGYCDYFSTSMVMMARSLGVPARWVKGYAPGSQPDPEFLQRYPENGMAYRVNNADAHSWAELYFGDYGWIPFEATPGFDAPILYDEEEDVPALAETTPQEEITSKANPGLMDQLNPATVRTVFLIALAIVVTWVVYHLRSAIYYGFFRLRLGRPLTLSEKAVMETLRIVGKMKRRGFARSGDETLRESFARWKEQEPGISAVLDGLLREFEQASYSPQAFSVSQWRIVQELGHKLNRMTRKRVRIPFLTRS